MSSSLFFNLEKTNCLTIKNEGGLKLLVAALIAVGITV